MAFWGMRRWWRWAWRLRGGRRARALVAVPRCLPGASGGHSQGSQAGDAELAVELAGVVAGRKQVPLVASVVQPAEQDAFTLQGRDLTEDRLDDGLARTSQRETLVLPALMAARSFLTLRARSAFRPMHRQQGANTESLPGRTQSVGPELVHIWPLLRTTTATLPREAPA